MQDRNPMYVKHVAFDWGLTISPDPRFELFPIIASELSKIFKECYNINLSPEEIEQKYFEVDSQSKASWGIGVTHFSQEELIIAELLEKLGMPYDDISLNAPLVLSIYRKKLKEYYKKLNWNKQVKDLLEFLKSQGFFISVFSNDRKHTIRAVLKWSGLIDYFDFIATAQEYEMPKVDKQVMEKFLQHAGFKPEETVFIGDDPIRDIKWAKESGVKAILFLIPEEFAPKVKDTSWRATKIEVQPDAIIRNLSELKNILRKS